MANINEIFSNISHSRGQINALLKQKKFFVQAEYEELKLEAERIKQKYINLNHEVNHDIELIGQKLQMYQDDLFSGGFISIQQFASDIAEILTKNTARLWEIVAVAFTYKKRVKQVSGLVLTPTDANIIAVAKKGAFSRELTNLIFYDKNWLNNNQAMLGFMEMVKRGDIVLLHIVEQDNKTEQVLNLFESGFNGDFDKYLLRFELEYNDKNPAHKYPVLYEYLDNYVYTELNRKGKR